MFVSGDSYDDEGRIILTDSNVENLSLVRNNRNEIHCHNSHGMTIDRELELRIDGTIYKTESV